MGVNVESSWCRRNSTDLWHATAFDHTGVLHTVRAFRIYSCILQSLPSLHSLSSTSTRKAWQRRNSFALQTLPWPRTLLCCHFAQLQKSSHTLSNHCVFNVFVCKGTDVIMNSEMNLSDYENIRSNCSDEFSE